MRSRRRPTVALFLLSTFALAVCDVATASRPRLISRDPPGAHGFAGWSRQASILWYSGGGSGWHVGGFHVAGFSGDTNRLVITRVATYAALVTLYARTNRNALSSNPRGVTAWIDFGIKT